MKKTLRGQVPYILVAILACLGVGGLLVWVPQRDLGGIVASAVSIGVAIGYAYWGRSHQIVLEGDVLTYRALFRRPVRVRMSEIQQAEVQLGVRSPEDSFRPFIRLMIVPGEDSAVSRFFINLKVFREEDVRILLRLLFQRGLLDSDDPPRLIKFR